MRAEEISSLSESAYRGSLSTVWGTTIDRIEALVQAQVKRRDG